MPTIRLDEISKFYKTSRQKQYPAISNISLTIQQGEFVFVVGGSGSGKSTLLGLMTGSIKPSRGNVYLDEINLRRLPPWARAAADLSFGQVRHQPQLLRRFTVEENLLTVAKEKRDWRDVSPEEKVIKALGIVGVSGAYEKYPGELSIAEIRRVDLARALINSPPILVLDELTASEDDDTGWDLLQLLREINQQGTTVIMATHASNMVNIMRRRVVTLVDGKILADIQRGKYGEIKGRFHRLK